MKKLLLIALALMGATNMSAQLTESPWTGSEVKEGTFYLYNVESGMWLQHNRRDRSRWTTSAQLGPHGFDVDLVQIDENHWQIDPKFGHNHSLNGYDDYGYMDTGRDVTPWIFSKTEKGYTIATDEETGALYVISAAELGDDFAGIDDGWYIDNLGWPEYSTWQLVTKEERMADLEKATKAEPKDATWLIGGWDFANQDDRNAKWQNELTGSGSGVAFRDGFGGWIANRAAEVWNGGHGDYYQIVTGLPNGTYGLTVQGYYRDGGTGGVYEKFVSGTEEIRAWYFANDVQQPFMSICDNGATEEVDNFFLSTSGFYGPGDGGDALPRAANAFYAGYYKNPEIKVVVTDGTLRIGIRKDSDTSDDWLCFDNFELTYYGSDIDLSEVLANLQNTLDEANAYEGTVLPVLAEAKSAGEAALSSSDAAAIAQATTNLQQALTAAKAMNAALASAEETAGAEWVPNFFKTALAEAQTAKDATEAAAVSEAAATLVTAVNDANASIDIRKFYFATVPFARQDGVAESVISETQPVIEASESRGAMNDALETLRTQRKIAVAEKHEDVFAGVEPADGDPIARDNDFYVYNVGLKRFLCGGGDWGAHAYVGFPGVEVTLIYDFAQSEGNPDEGIEAKEWEGYQIDTHLNNGGENEFLNYGGYMDTGSRDLWEFVPVEGKPGVYNIARANGETNEAGQRMLLGYRDGTYGNIDTDMYGESNPNNQWKLVTRAERDALLKTATADKPQDASYKIECPNFNQREDDQAWVHDTGTIWGRGGNNKDFAFECWNSSALDLSQVVYDLEPGWYVLSAQGFYREGDHEYQTWAIGSGGEVLHEAILVADFEELAMMNITDEIDKAPGLGSQIRVAEELNENGDAVRVDNGGYYVGEYPYWCWQACDYFESGLYKHQLKVKVDNSGTLQIGVIKNHEQARDWVVVDNFRLTYYGTEEPDIDGVEAVRDELASQKSADNAIYTIAGQRVSKAARGLYIKNGRKVVVK
ncbi:MAG: hypothetical protein IJ209_05685 [Bacteroidaceae bacterium]|nr:hypothetical protein [Bacteroidaceae bacterium]